MLSENEKKVLLYLKNVIEAKDKDIAEHTGLNLDGARRSMYFLSEKGLLEIKTNVYEHIEITEKGKKALNGDFEEKQLLSYDGKDVKDIPKELLGFIGMIKGKYITIENNKLNVIKDLDDYWVILKLKEGVYDPYLEKRGFIRKNKVKEYIAIITDKGKAYVIDEGGLKVLNEKILKTGVWKDKGFASLNIKPGDVKPSNIGRKHIIRRAIDIIKDIFVSMGFREMEGGYLEESFWNFDALFQPQDHPSRELADTFYVEGEDLNADANLIQRVKEAHEKYWRYKWSKDEASKLVLRTHTTVLSARTLAKYKEGKFFAIGRVFRNEAIDFKHLAEFHQIEGIISFKGCNFRHLLGILKAFYNKLGFDKIRFRPSYFPYTEPSLEIEVFFDKKKEWIELGGAGMFRKQVVEPLGVKHNVLAFGLSLERPLMLMLGLNDIRDFYYNDYNKSFVLNELTFVNPKV